MTQVSIQESSHVSRGFHALEGRVMMWTQRCFLRSFYGVLGDVLILYRIAVLPYFDVLGGLSKGATRATAVGSGWRLLWCT